MVIGTAAAGAGLIAASLPVTATTVLYAELRFQAITALDLTRQLAVLGWIMAVVAIGGGLVSIFGAHILAAGATTLLSFVILGHRAQIRPRLDSEEVRSFVVEAAPVALSQAVTSVYARGLVILMSVLTSARETGLFAASYRVVAILLAVPAITLSGAFPVLAHAGAEDERRLSSALARLAEAGLAVAILLTLLVAIGAKPLINLVGGQGYAGAVPVLRIQALMLVGAFLTQVWGYGFLAARREHALVGFNLLAVLLLAVSGVPLIVAFGPRGAALSAVIVETLLAVIAVTMPVLARPTLELDLVRVLRLFCAAGIAAIVALAVGLPEAGAAAVAGVIYVVLMFVFRAVPPGILYAMRVLAR
jgi:O-antigen/teichoic acid export membrane protein